MRDIELSLLVEMNIQTFEARNGEEAIDILKAMGFLN